MVVLIRGREVTEICSFWKIEVRERSQEMFGGRVEGEDGVYIGGGEGLRALEWCPLEVMYAIR